MAAETVHLICPIAAKTFECPKDKGIPYGAKKAAATGLARPEQIFFSPYSGVGIAYPQPSESQLSAFYEQGDYWKTGKEEIFSPRTSPGLYAMALARWQTVQPVLDEKLRAKGISILDIGGGHGYFGMAVKREGTVPLKKYAVAEMDEVFRRSLKKTWANISEVLFQAEDQLARFTDRYDLVVLSHILEHLLDPRAMLLEAMERMQPEGYLFIDVPHEDFRFKGDVFPHILFYNPRSLCQLVESVGLSVLAVGCYGKEMQRSPMNYINENNFASFISKVMYKTRTCWPAAVLTHFYTNYFGAAEKNENGTWIRLIARRKGRT